MRICKKHLADLEREVEQNPQLWYGLFGTVGYWIVPKSEMLIVLELKVRSLEKRVENLEKEIYKRREASEE